MVEQQEIPEKFSVNGTDFVAVDSPEDLSCWVAVNSDAEVSFIAEPPEAPSLQIIELLAQIIENFSEVTEAAAGFLRTELRDEEFALPEAEIALLEAETAPFDLPDAVVWSDGSWMLRFSETGIESLAGDYGIGVNFIGQKPESVEVLADLDEVGDDA